MEGKSNVYADWLSRSDPEDFPEDACVPVMVAFDEALPTLDDMYREGKEEGVPEGVVDTGTQLRHHKTGCFYIPKKCRENVVLGAHAGSKGVHMGVQRSYRYLKRFTWWPNQLVDVAAYLRKCVVCGMMRTQDIVDHGSLSKPCFNEMVALDSMGPINRDGERWYIVTMIDHATRLAMNAVVPHLRGQEVAKNGG